MKTKSIVLWGTALAVLFAASPVRAGSMICAGAAYCNGEVNGTLNAFGLTTNFKVSDSFTLGSGGTVTGFSFGVWASGQVTSIDWAILSGGPDTTAGGTVISSHANSALSTTLDLGFNALIGYDVSVVSLTGLNIPLSAGTYYLELSNGVGGGEAFWDENGGPSGNGLGSTAWASSYGYLTSPSVCNAFSQGYCSESFAIYTSSTPEPGSLALEGSGILLLAGLLRRHRQNLTSL